MANLYRKIEPKEGVSAQYCATYILRWNYALCGEPDTLFVEDEAVEEKLIPAVEELLSACLSGQEARLLMVGVNAPAMSNPDNENGQRLNERCDQIDEAIESVKMALAAVKGEEGHDED